MRRLSILGILIAVVSLLVLASCVPFWAPGYQQSYPYGPGGGMGPGMMGRGMGPGMMGGGWGNYNKPNPNAKPLTIDQAADSARRYVESYYGKGLEITEIMDFAWNFYADVKEKDTGIHATELLIDKYTGQVYPEMGPNTMWNAKYGMMARGYTSGAPSEMPVKPEQAKALAQQFMDGYLAGRTIDEVETFYGYYTLHTLKDGKIEGMLSVNGYTGAVWYHNWHGPFVDMKEFD